MCRSTMNTTLRPGDPMSQRDNGYSLFDWVWIILGAGIILTCLWLAGAGRVAPEIIVIDVPGVAAAI